MPHHGSIGMFAPPGADVMHSAKSDMNIALLANTRIWWFLYLIAHSYVTFAAIGCCSLCMQYVLRFLSRKWKNHHSTKATKELGSTKDQGLHEPLKKLQEGSGEHATKKPKSNESGCTFDHKCCPDELASRK